MFRKMFFAAAMVASSSFVSAQSIVGSGSKSVEVVFDWADGFVADYDAHYGADPISGYDATQIALNDPNLSLSWGNFGTTANPNYFLNVASYTGGHTGDGATFDFTTAPSNYWHEYVDTGSGWEYGGGASADSLNSGDRIGWVFGSEALPVPEPVCAAAIGVLGLMLLRHRRNDQ